MTESKQVGGAKDIIGDITPKLAELTDDVLFADVWNRSGLSPRDRSLITVASIITGGNTSQLTGHIKRALANGVTQEELVEVVTHLAFYAEWPKAMSAAALLRNVVTGESCDGPSSVGREEVAIGASSTRRSRRGYVDRGDQTLESSQGGSM